MSIEQYIEKIQDSLPGSLICGRCHESNTCFPASITFIEKEEYYEITQTYQCGNCWKSGFTTWDILKASLAKE